LLTVLLMCSGPQLPQAMKDETLKQLTLKL